MLYPFTFAPATDPAAADSSHSAKPMLMSMLSSLARLNSGAVLGDVRRVEAESK